MQAFTRRQFEQSRKRLATVSVLALLASLIPVPSLSAATTVASGSGLERPYGIAFDASGSLFVANEIEAGAAHISEVDITSGLVSLFSDGASVGGFVGLSGAAFSPTGVLHISDDSNRVFQVDEFGVATVFITDASIDSNPNGIAFDGSGNLYVTTAGNGNVAKFDSTGVLVDPNITVPDQTFSVPQGIVVDDVGGRVLVQDFDGTIYTINIATGATNILVESGADGGGHIALDSGGNLFITSFNENKVLRVDAVDVSITTCDFVETPRGITFDSFGTLFVTAFDTNEIVRIDSCLGLPPDAEPPGIQVSLTNNWVQGQGFAADSSVVVTINAGSSFAVGTDGAGNFFADPGQLGDPDLVTGDTVEVSDGTTTRILILDGPLSVEVVDDPAGASGVLPVGADVQVDVGGEDCGAGAFINDVDDGSTDGLWSIAFTSECPAGFGRNFGGQVRVFDDDGDATIAEPPEPPGIQVSLTNNWVQGQGFAADSSVVVTINAGSSFAVGTDGAGNFFADPGQLGDPDLVTGDTVEVSDGTTTRILILDGPLSVEVVDDPAGASGVLPVGADVQVDVGGEDCGAGAFINDVDDGSTDGLWSIAFTSECPAGFGRNFGGQVRVFDDDGDATIAEPLPLPAFLVRQATPFHFIQWNHVHGFNWPEGVTVTLNVYDDPVTPDLLYTDQATAASIPGEPCCPGFVEFVPDTFTFQAGHFVELTDGTTTKTHVVTELMITGFDVDTDTVSGTAEPDSDVNVFVFTEFGDIFRHEIADSVTGEWVADLRVPGDELGEDVFDIAVGSEIHVSQTDEDNDSTDYQLTVVFSVGPIDGPTEPVALGTDVELSAPFNSPDVVAASWFWGDGTVTAGTVDISGGGGSTTASHDYGEPGVYEVSLSITDNAGRTAGASFQFVVVFNPAGGFVTGGGWIDSPAGAYAADPTLTGQANFGFVSKYKKGANVPTGNTNFQFQAGDLHFQSASYDWLVVAGQDRAKFKGAGTINGAGDYGFLLTAVDDPDGDAFRIKIWDKNDGDAVVYDNKLGSGEGSYGGTSLGGGNIVIHKTEFEGPLLNSANGHFYEAVTVSGGIDWFDARVAAESRSFRGVHGHLVTITSAQENDFIATNFPKAYPEIPLPRPPGCEVPTTVENTCGFSYWFGGFQPLDSPEPDGDWRWVTGEPFDYTNWADDEPNNFLDRPEDCLAALQISKWNDSSCYDRRHGGYVVEYDNG